MSKVNPNFSSIQREYIFPVIERKLAELRQRRPDASIINLGIGDVALPLAPTIVDAICQAVQEMGVQESIRGYGPSEGYLFLRQAIAEHEYAHLGISPEEIFISDGINSDAVNILDLFHLQGCIGIPDPTYPAYLDSSVMEGWKDKIIFLPCREEHGFAPQPPQEHCDLIYLCSPNNPTGVALTREQLTAWVDYARRNKAILLYDNAYVAFITSSSVPKSIFEIEGAKEVAIEFRSFSKTAGFTGLRCAYTVLPKSVKGELNGHALSLHALWKQRQNTKFNGVAYPIQKGAEAVYSQKGQMQTKQQVASYLTQASILREGLIKMGYTCYGGVDSPYIWWKTPQNLASWEFFTLLLERCHLITIPGKGFGAHGEGYIRLSAFTSNAHALETLNRLSSVCASF